MRAVPKLPPDPTPESRYSSEKIGIEIRSCIKRVKIHGFHTRVAEYLGLDSQGLTHRLGGETKLSIEQAGAIADYMRAPPGWPFVEWEMARTHFGGHRIEDIARNLGIK